MEGLAAAVRLPAVDLDGDPLSEVGEIQPEQQSPDADRRLEGRQGQTVPNRDVGQQRLEHAVRRLFTEAAMVGDAPYGAYPAATGPGDGPREPPHSGDGDDLSDE